MCETGPSPSPEGPGRGGTDRPRRYPDGVPTANRLAAETSPYLRQHANNPVDWYPWGEEAFAKAAAEDKPIFLSVGYSACHWCHVMAHESFEDPAVARPAQRRVRLRQGRPRGTARRRRGLHGGRPGDHRLRRVADERLPDPRPAPVLRWHVLPAAPTCPAGRRSPPCSPPSTDLWGNRRAEVEAQADELAAAIATRSVVESPVDAPPLLGGPGGEVPDLLGPAVDELARRFDPEWGGFGGAPKFPQPTLVDLALRQAVRAPGTEGGAVARAMATRTLDAMAAGGIHDHLGGGFARYATDTEWLVPHFEKMLYDQAGPAAGLPPRLAGDRRSPVPRGGRGHRRLRDPRPDRPRGRRALGRGRRLRGCRGPVLRVDPRRGRPGGR